MIKRLGGWVIWILILEFLIFFMIGRKLVGSNPGPRVHIVQTPPAIVQPLDSSLRSIA